MIYVCGWSQGRWVQIGSSEDRHIQALARVTVYMTRLRYAMSLTTTSAKRATQAFQELGASIERSRLW